MIPAQIILKGGLDDQKRALKRRHRGITARNRISFFTVDFPVALI